MKNALLIVGENIRYNEPFVRYVIREVSKSIATINTIYNIDNNDKNLPFLIEEIIQRNDEIVITTTKNSLNVVGKIVSTLNSDNLEVKDNMLIPSKTTVYTDNSYLIELEKKLINVIMVEELEKLPKVLIQQNEDVGFFHLIGLDEDSSKILLEPLAKNFDIKIVVSSIVEGWSYITAKCNKFGQMHQFLKSVKSLFPDKMIEQKDIVGHIVSKLIHHNKTITIAESCTGGLLSSMFTKKAGVSQVFKGSLITYSDELKDAWLGVSNDTLEKFGAVSELCVREMMEGALNVATTDLSIAISGIAGPGGGSEEKPVGTVFVGARNKEQTIHVERLLLKGDREYIQTQAAYHALKLLLMIEKNIFF